MNQVLGKRNETVNEALKKTPFVTKNREIKRAVSLAVASITDLKEVKYV